MPLTPIIDNTTIKKLTDEPKFGIVIENNDPDQLGKVKVYIPGIFEGRAENLPWIRRKNDTTFCGMDAELFDVPSIGSIVEVRWSYDENTPVYQGPPYNKKQRSGLFLNNYPHEGGIRFGKCYLKFDKASNLLTLSNGKAFIQCDPMGNISFTCTGNMDLTCKGDVNIAAVNTNISGNLNVEGDIACARAASGTINLTNAATVVDGIVRSIQ